MFFYLKLSLIDFFYIYSFIYILILILSVAYFTLLERKFIAVIQRRKGPDYTGYFGILQPMADALKLLLKDIFINKLSFSFFFYLAPLFIFFSSLLSWAFIPFTYFNSYIYSNYSLIWLLLFSTFSTYFLFLAGFSSNSKYAFLGAIRSLIQLIAYEISISFLLLPIIFMSSSFNLNVIAHTQSFFLSFNYLIFLPNFILLFICFLAETNRAPFDLPEAEAELVAGYNLEYSSIPFAYFFLAEYLNLLLIAVLLNILFFSIYKFSFFISFFFFFTKTAIIIITLIWIRATFPRLRYDNLLSFSWKYILFFSLILFLYYLSLYVYSLNSFYFF